MSSKNNHSSTDPGITRLVSLKTPKGMRDNSAIAASARQKIIDILSECCRSFDAELLDTPHLELKEVLDSKYGEEQKLIYNVEDFEGERLALRYDLTVPLARYLAANKIQSLRRYQFGKVFRRDNPKMNRGRMREFYQFDFDIAGEFDPMVPDSECILLICTAMKRLGLDCIVRVNHRKLLQGILTACGIQPEKLKSVCSSIDKLDKRSWAEVKDELVRIKYIPEDVVDSIGRAILQTGTLDSLDDIMCNCTKEIRSNQLVSVGINDLKTLYTFLCAFQIEKQVQLELSLARGLDYYTGVIYEAVVPGQALVDAKTGEDINIGSVAAGGRYDGLVSGFTDSAKDFVPCVGVSFGVERLATIMERKGSIVKRPTCTEVYIASPQKGFLIARMQLAKELLDQGIKVAFCPKQKSKFLTQLQYCEAKRIPICLVLSQSELEQSVVKLRMVETRQEIVVSRSELHKCVRTKLSELSHVHEQDT